MIGRVKQTRKMVPALRRCTTLIQGYTLKSIVLYRVESNLNDVNFENLIKVLFQ